MATAPLTFERTLRCLAVHPAKFGDWPLLLARFAALAETA